MSVLKQHEHSQTVLQAAGIRPTRQRRALATLLFDGQHKHMTAENVFAAARKDRTNVSLATVYNTLHQFTKAGLLREVVIDSNRVYFDTNVGPHHHFFDETTGRLHDIPADTVHIAQLPRIPRGRKLDRVDVIIRLRSRRQ
jgi:Fur family iron response transcriptional regulator